MSSQENLKINTTSNSKHYTSINDTTLKNSSYKKIKNIRPIQQKVIGLKTPSSIRHTKTLAVKQKFIQGDRFIPFRTIGDDSKLQYLLLANKKKDEILTNDDDDNNFSNININNNNSINTNNNNNNTDQTITQQDGNSTNNNNFRANNSFNYNSLVLDSLMLKSNDTLNVQKNRIKGAINNLGNNHNKSNISVENESRVLTFTMKNKSGNCQSNTGSYINNLKNLGESKNYFVNKNENNSSERIISKTPERILDAPNLIDDYYLNLLDWSMRNVLAVSLGMLLKFKIYFFTKLKNKIILINN